MCENTLVNKGGSLTDAEAKAKGEKGEEVLVVLGVEVVLPPMLVLVLL